MPCLRDARVTHAGPVRPGIEHCGWLLDGVGEKRSGKGIGGLETALISVVISRTRRGTEERGLLSGDL